jgi:uncharacterized protein YbcC (UPF0753/DUF2309 family)
MSPAIGEELRIRAMIYVAGEPVPFFWPMRSFIHHNPLHGLEQLPFDEAVEKGTRLFHARGFLPRAAYRRYLDSGQVDRSVLERGVRQFIAEQPASLQFKPLDGRAFLHSYDYRVDPKRRLLENIITGPFRLLVIDPEDSALCLYDCGEWRRHDHAGHTDVPTFLELCSA